MASNADIQLIDANLIATLQVSPADTAAYLAEFARDVLISLGNGGQPPSHETIVDGVVGASEDSVRPNGKIVYELDLMGDVLRWIHEQLLVHAPRRSGQYQGSINLYGDGEHVADMSGVIPAAATYVFLSGVPYARKIEAGESSQAPDGVFQAIATLAASQFGNQAQIRFGYISPEAEGINDWAETSPARALAGRARGGRQALHTEWLTRVPAITVSALNV